MSFKSELNGDPADPIDGPKRLKFDLFGETPYGGDTAVKSFDQIILRNGSHDSIFSTHYSHSRGNYTRARYFSDRQIEMGHLSMRGRFVHVYLNGVYNGQYHLMERPNADFMATHQGGEEADYDIMKGRSGVKAMGDAQAQTNAWITWNTLKNNLDNYSTV
ncbi:MAG: CotH kinase family protein [Akkermansiaceae bacterium]|nr:CotH kinase family protein [Akkermansiaceae bacterium]